MVFSVNDKYRFCPDLKYKYISVYTISMQFFIQLCEHLNKRKVDYAVAGGWAIALHQIPRMTFDVDIVIAMNRENFLKVEQALKELGLQSRIPVQGEQIFKFRKEYIEEKNLIAWNFTNPLVPSEIVDVLLTEDRQQLKTEQVQLGNTLIPVLSVEAMISLKEKANRPQDQEDIIWLKKLLP